MGETSTNTSIRYFFKGTVAVSAGRAVGEGLNFLGFVAVARWFGIEIAGVFFLALSILNVMSTATRLGLDNSLIKYSSECLYKRTFNRISILLSIAIIGISVFSVIVLGGWLGARNWLAPLFSTPRAYWMVTVILMALPCYSVATVLVSATRGAKNINYHVALTFVLFPVAFLILLLATRNAPWQDFAPFASYAVGTLLFCGAAVWAVRRMYRFRLMLRVFGTRLSKNLIIYSLPLWISSLISILYLRTDLFFVSQFF
ncbi:MAG TPA: oligosaccharide flippase family protein, partial [Acidobacteriota bacterium]|nr:oligosaccharide flippase family protein [Acidobacteriota bacterium]